MGTDKQLIKLLPEAEAETKEEEGMQWVTSWMSGKIEGTRQVKPKIATFTTTDAAAVVCGFNSTHHLLLLLLWQWE